MSKINRYPIVVVGAGPAGSAAAIRLSQLGIECALIDRAAFPRDKICGDGISSKILPLLAKLAIDPHEVLKAGYGISQMIIYGPRGQVLKTRLLKKSLQSSLCCPRHDFDYILFKKAGERHQHLFSPAKLTEMKRVENSFELTLNAQGKSLKIHTPLIIVADGVHSLMAYRLGLLPQRKKKLIIGARQYFKGSFFPSKVHIVYDRAILPGYVWIFPVSKNVANVGLMYHGAGRAMTPLFKNLLQQNAILNRLLKEAEPLDKIKHSVLPPGTIPGRRITDGAILIGDAAAFVNPLTGGGIYNAILSGIKAAEVAARAVKKNDFNAQNLMPYEMWWRENLLPGFRLADFTVKWLSRPNRANLIFSLGQKNLLARRLFFMNYGQILPRPLKKMIKFLERHWKTRARSD